MKIRSRDQPRDGWRLRGFGAAGSHETRLVKSSLYPFDAHASAMSCRWPNPLSATMMFHLTLASRCAVSKLEHSFTKLRNSWSADATNVEVELVKKVVGGMDARLSGNIECAALLFCGLAGAIKENVISI